MLSLFYAERDRSTGPHRKPDNPHALLRRSENLASLLLQVSSSSLAIQNVSSRWRKQKSDADHDICPSPIHPQCFVRADRDPAHLCPFICSNYYIKTSLAFSSASLAAPGTWGFGFHDISPADASCVMLPHFSPLSFFIKELPPPKKIRQHHYLILCTRLQGFCLNSPHPLAPATFQPDPGRRPCGQKGISCHADVQRL